MVHSPTVACRKCSSVQHHMSVKEPLAHMFKTNGVIFSYTWCCLHYLVDSQWVSPWVSAVCSPTVVCRKCSSVYHHMSVKEPLAHMFKTNGVIFSYTWCCLHYLVDSQWESPWVSAVRSHVRSFFDILCHLKFPITRT